MSALRVLAVVLLCGVGQAALAAPTACVAPAAPAAEAGAVMQANARLLAGLSPGGVHGREISGLPFWAAHAAAMDTAWAATSKRQLDVWRAFSEREIGALEASRGALYYPFSGPDFMYAHTMFPKARRYLLVGLEEPGTEPLWSSMDEGQAAASFAQMRQSTATLMRYSFFRTHGMQNDLRRGKLTGVAPVLMAMAARIGFDVRALDQVHLDDAGALCLGPAGPGGISGVRLVLAEAGTAQTRDLVYLRADLSDPALARTPQLALYVKSLGPGPVFLKAASYLMHRPQFSGARDLVLERARLILQDDSGIPFKAYSPTRWNGRLYGSYTKPIAIFKDRKQPSLREAYARNAKPLHTGIGYKHRSGTSNLQLFEKRAATLSMR